MQEDEGEEEFTPLRAQKWSWLETVIAFADAVCGFLNEINLQLKKHWNYRVEVEERTPEPGVLALGLLMED